MVIDTQRDAVEEVSPQKEESYIKLSEENTAHKKQFNNISTLEMNDSQVSISDQIDKNHKQKDVQQRKVQMINNRLSSTTMENRVENDQIKNRQ